MKELFIGFFLLLGCLLPAWGAPRRVVTLLPSHSEIVVALDALDCLVGVSDAERSQDFPSLPRVGGVVPRWEALVALSPDWVLADRCHQRFRREFERFHLNVRFLPTTGAKTIEDVFQQIQEIGRLLERAPQAEALVTRLEETLDKLDHESPRDRRPRAFFEIWPTPLQAAGPDSLQGHLLVRAGFENVVPSLRNETPLLSPEWVTRANPDVIFYTHLSSEHKITHRPGWARISAVKRGCVVALDPDLFSRAGPKVVEALVQLRQILTRLNGAPQ